ncbi:uncharacterized protein BO66DRAFT_425281 [Aspergillus aculeatinus CBS 121060]|uniref:Uncharacterized protein n=1 Tax=Aspergillus aculeatinus CBS 121060 TaxID=1448322 RepID=A0ACD1HND0_9EURO|nr:hypothetical protein BO66DRAFT_425281 [Aspergillus aculeatinus CBS 121060]RAH74892.1 hypothetical protein BO66DRAFT_425281 [Aspergillus aculeatinus CBS 121060]
MMTKVRKHPSTSSPPLHPKPPFLPSISALLTLDPQTLALVATTLAVAVTANPTVGYAGYFYENCTTPSIDAGNAYAGSCLNVENFPIKSFTAYVESGSCADGTSAVLHTYTASGCDESTLFETVSVDTEKQCFEADVTLVSIKSECV